MSGPTDEAYANGRRSGESWASVRLVKLEREVEAFRQEWEAWRETFEADGGFALRNEDLVEAQETIDAKDTRIGQLLIERNHFHDAFKREVAKRKALEADVRRLRQGWRT